MLKYVVNLLFLTLLIPGLFAQAELIDGIAAIVGNQVILKSDVLQLVQMTAVEKRLDPALDEEKIAQMQNNILQNLIDQKLILEIAEVESIEVKDREVDAALDQHLNSIIAQLGSEQKVEELFGKPLKHVRRELWDEVKDRLVTQRFQANLIRDVTITRDEVVMFYYQFKDSLGEIPTLYNVSDILLPISPGAKSMRDAFEKAVSIRNRILAGEDFSELARTFSQDPGSAKQGGDLGVVTRGTLVPEFEQVAFSLKSQEISEVVQTTFGYHIIQAIDRLGNKVNLRHILIIPQVSDADEDSIYAFVSAIRDTIVAGGDFALLASKYSASRATKNPGGDIGWINPQTFPIAEISKVITSYTVPQILPPIRAKDGYHIVKINDIKPGGIPTLESHWTEIERVALAHKQRRFFQHWLQESASVIFVKNNLTPN